jgi:hypothetical protein
LKELIEAGKTTPVIDRTYPLSEVPEAIRYLEEGHGAVPRCGLRPATTGGEGRYRIGGVARRAAVRQDAARLLADSTV